MRGARPTMTVPRASSGIPGLDPLMDGGFPLHRAVLLRGRPGTGKTLFGLQFLVKGFASGEVIVDGTITAEATAIYVQERRPEARISGAGTLRRPSRGPSGPAPEAP